MIAAIATLAIFSYAHSIQTSETPGLAKNFYIAEIYTNGKNLITFLPKDYVQNELKRALAEEVANTGGDYELLYACIKQESEFNPLAIGDGGLAVNVAQFHPLTFKRLCNGNYHNAYDQLSCFVKLNANKKDKNWSCWKVI